MHTHIGYIEKARIMLSNASRRATIHRMVMTDHICPYGLKTLDLLRRKGFEVDDQWLTTRAETDAFKAKHGVKTTPQTFINGERIGGYDDLRRYFDKPVADPDATRIEGTRVLRQAEDQQFPDTTPDVRRAPGEP